MLTAINSSKPADAEVLFRDRELRKKVSFGLLFFRVDPAREKTMEGAQGMGFSEEALAHREPQHLPNEILLYLKELIQCLKNYLGTDAYVAKELLNMFLERSGYVGALLDKSGKLNVNYFKERQFLYF